jgi:hypothetical protein
VGGRGGGRGGGGERRWGGGTKGAARVKVRWTALAGQGRGVRDKEQGAHVPAGALESGRAGERMWRRLSGRGVCVGGGGSRR